MTDTFPNRRYIVCASGQASSEGARYKEPGPAVEAARKASMGGPTDLHVFDEGEPVGRAIFKDGKMNTTEGDARPIPSFRT